MTKYLLLILLPVALFSCGEGTKAVPFGGWKSLESGWYHVCAIDTEDQLYCWGSNQDGEIGNGEGGDGLVSKRPVMIGHDTWSVVSPSNFHTCGIKTDGSLFCWGDNEYGRLGDGTRTMYDENLHIIENANKDSPILIMPGTWLTVSAGEESTCGITTDHLLYCWGHDAWIMLGDDIEEDKLVPTKINEEQWSSIFMGWRRACGLTLPDNKLYCWGFGDDWQAGDDAWSIVTMGMTFACGIKSADKKLYCWGENFHGQLGDGTTESRKEPTKVDDDAWVAIAAGSNHVCGIKEEGPALYCWGDNVLGQLGNGEKAVRDEDNDIIDNKNQLTPQKIGNDSWSMIAAGNIHTCGIKEMDPKIHCWGDNGFYQYGDGTQNEKLSPP